MALKIRAVVAVMTCAIVLRADAAGGQGTPGMSERVTGPDCLRPDRDGT